MPLKVAVQMDPIHGIDKSFDATIRILVEAQSRGHELWYYTPEELGIREGTVLARARRLRFFDRRGERHALESDRVLPLFRSRCRLASAGPSLRHGLYHDHAFIGGRPSVYACR